MGNVQCTSLRNTNEAWNAIENNLDSENSNLERKILNEFYYLKDMFTVNNKNNQILQTHNYNIKQDNEYRLDQDIFPKLYAKIYQTSVSINKKTKMERLLKWNRMALNSDTGPSFLSSNKLNDILKNDNEPILYSRPEIINSQNFNNNVEQYDTNSISSIPLDKSHNVINLTNHQSENYFNNSNNSNNNRIINRRKSISSSFKFNLSNMDSEERVEKIDNYTTINLFPQGMEKSLFGDKVEKNLLDFYEKNKSKFLERVAKGPPNCFRWLAWKICGNIIKEIKEETFYYFLNKEIEENTDTQIKKDLNRTLPDKPCFNLSEIQTYLYNILRAFANMDCQVSYCQGMNFVAGFLLIISDFNQLESFYMLISLFSYDTFHSQNTHVNFGIRGFFSDDFPTLKFYLYVFDYYFNKKMPNMRNHFLKIDIPQEVWISKWFHTLFTICLPLYCVARLWDCLLSIGLDFLINFTLALLKKRETELLKMQDIFEVIDFFKVNFQQNENLDIEEIINDAKKIGIDKGNHFLLLKREYEEKNSVNLSKLKIKYNLNINPESLKHNKINYYRIISRVNTPVKSSPIFPSSMCATPSKNSDNNLNYNCNNNYIAISDLECSSNISGFTEDFEKVNIEEENTKKINSMEHANVSNFLKTTIPSIPGSQNENKTNIENFTATNTNTLKFEEEEGDDESICSEFNTNEINTPLQQVNTKISSHTITQKDVGISRMRK